MNKFHYEYVYNKFSAKLLFTDTDSLVYEIKVEDVYEQSFKDKHLFDFSEYPINSKYHDISGKTIIGRMKDEFKGQKISQFVGLKNKMFLIITVNDQEVSKAKGVNKKLRHKEYVDVDVCLIKK